MWLRRHFNPGPLTAADVAKLVVRDRHGGMMQVYVNGQLACTGRRGADGYHVHLMTDAGRSAVRPGADNVIAVHCHQDRGDVSADVGLAVRGE